MEIATPTYDDDAFHHAGGRIRRWSEETGEVPALTPDSTFVIRLARRRNAYQRVIAGALGVLALVAIIGAVIGPSTRAEEVAPLAGRSVRAAALDPTPLAGAKRTLATHVRHARRGR